MTPDELQDRLDRGKARIVVASQDQVGKFDGLRGDGLIRVVVVRPDYRYSNYARLRF